MTFQKSLSLVVLLTITTVAHLQANHEKHADLQFASVDGKELLLDLYLPENAEDSPLVIWIHGGGWRGGNKNGCSIKWLTEHGYSIASISYRLTQQAKFPAQIHDVKAAVRWLRAHADDYGYDPERIAVAGSSAGGHLAALLGVSHGIEELEGDVGKHNDQSSKVSAVVNFYGASDFILRSRTQPVRANAVGSVVYDLLGGPASVLIEQAVLASPAFHVTSDDPPMIILHGVDDNTVLIDQAVRMFERYLASNLAVELHALDGSGHGGPEFNSGPNAQAILAFLERHL